MSHVHPAPSPASRGRTSVAHASGPGPVAARSGRRQNALLLATASVLALWLGLAAPAVSPVTPPLTAQVATVDTAAPAGPPDPLGLGGGRR